MKELVILTEEPSITPVFWHLHGALNLAEVHMRVIPHAGVSDLEKSLPRKLKAWKNPAARFLIVRDNDNGDCIERKSKLQTIVNDAGREKDSLVRIVCQELEAWFLGDRNAMNAAGVLPASDNPAKLRGNPDQLNKPSKLLDDHLNGYAKIRSAELIAEHLDIENNSSPSFNATVEAVKRLVEE